MKVPVVIVWQICARCGALVPTSGRRSSTRDFNSKCCAIASRPRAETPMPLNRLDAKYLPGSTSVHDLSSEPHEKFNEFIQRSIDIVFRPGLPSTKPFIQHLP